MHTEALDPARWSNGPAICRAANLPAFANEKDARAFFDGLPAIAVEWIGQCRHCGGVHAYASAREPSGASSGTGTRKLTMALPEHVRESNAHMSARASAGL